MRSWKRQIGVAVLTVALAPSLAAGEIVQGITLSTHTDGGDWAGEGIESTMVDLRSIGANWVAIHPYARIGADGSVRYRSMDAGSPPEHLARPIRAAHAAGLKILIKPHLAYWGSPFGWRGDIAFAEPAEWERFWTDYSRWIITLAAVCQGADGFVVGTELERTVLEEGRWRRLIAAVRRTTDVPLTYAANWDRFEEVRFWDALDVIGIQAYFPLLEAIDGGDAAHDAAIGAGWKRWMERLRLFSQRQNRAILFTELGYSQTLDAPVRPWEGKTQGPAAGDVAERCMRAALSAMQQEPSVVGAFLWKWFPEPHPVGRNFRLATPGMRAVIREAWLR